MSQMTRVQDIKALGHSISCFVDTDGRFVTELPTGNEESPYSRHRYDTFKQAEEDTKRRLTEARKKIAVPFLDYKGSEGGWVTCTVTGIHAATDNLIYREGRNTVKQITSSRVYETRFRSDLTEAERTEYADLCRLRTEVGMKIRTFESKNSVDLRAKALEALGLATTSAETPASE